MEKEGREVNSLDSFADGGGHRVLGASRDAQRTHPLVGLLEDARRAVRPEQLEDARDVAPEARPVERGEVAHRPEPLGDLLMLGAVLELIELGELDRREVSPVPGVGALEV